MERVHRLGRKSDGKQRPVIVKFYNYNEKMSILHAAYKLKGTGISVGEDFSVRVRQARRNLWNSCASEREKGIKVKLQHDRLVMGNDSYTWDEQSCKRVRTGER